MAAPAPVAPGLAPAPAMLDARAFGMQGNGVHDAAPALTNALAAAAGRPVYVPPGNRFEANRAYPIFVHRADVHIAGNVGA